jgi:hypothetical protein
MRIARQFVLAVLVALLASGAAAQQMQCVGGGCHGGASTTTHCLMNSNGSVTDMSNCTYASGTVSIAGSFPLGLSGLDITNGTMTRELAAGVKTVLTSFTWTNAMVTALATTAGDIKVATLPAKTMVQGAIVVITGAAVGPTTVTVACGRTSATYIDYVVASDAKAAANTIYGDANAEKGTGLASSALDIPSYTATTDVFCHFVSTGANLSTVTGSTGRVILMTTLLP